MKKIILDEKAYAEHILRTASLNRLPYKALVCLARYNISLGLDAREHIGKLDFDYPLERILKDAGKRRLLEIQFLPVYAQELQTIQAIHGLQRQRVAFALLVLAKYQNCVHEKNNDWVSFRHKEIFSLANVKLSVYNQCLLLNDLKAMGLLRFGKRVDNLNVNVTYLCAGGDKLLEIRDMRNLGYQYMRYCGGSYLECAVCGVVVPRKSPRQRYCGECSQAEQARKTIERYRKKMEKQTDLKDAQIPGPCGV